MLDEQRMVRTLLVEQPKVLAYIQSMVRQPDLADDIFQDVCALAMEKRSQIVDDLDYTRLSAEFNRAVNSLYVTFSPPSKCRKPNRLRPALGLP